MAITVVNPATGETIETFAEHTADEVEARVQKAQNAFEALRETSYADRAVWMKKAADIMESEVADLAKMLVIEMGKPIAQAEAEVLKCAKNMRFYANNAEKFLADEPLGSRGWRSDERSADRHIDLVPPLDSDSERKLRCW